MNAVYRRTSVRLLPVAVVLYATCAGSASAETRPAVEYGNLPLSFERNAGQAPASVRYQARGGSHYRISLEDSRAVMTVQSKTGTEVVKISPVGASRVAPTAEDLLPGRSNYILGRDPNSWKTGIPNFRGVRYTNVYPGIDWLYYGNQRKLEYDFVVAPGSDPNQIRLRIEGAQRARLESATGDLLLELRHGVLRQHKPVVYQMAGNRRQPIEGRYRLTQRGEVAFALGAYDRGKPLVIDPVLAYWTYIGGASAEAGNAIAVDSTGNAYLTGFTQSSTGVSTIRPYGGGAQDVFVTKVNASGTQILYSTYLGGSADEIGEGIAVDSQNRAYITGATSSANFPLTGNAIRTVPGGTDGFVTRLNADGTISYSTLLGGSQADIAYAVAVDSAFAMYVTGVTQSTDFTGLSSVGYSGERDAFVMKISTAGTVLYSIYAGGAQRDEPYGIAVDANWNCYITGITLSAGIATPGGSFQPAYAGNTDAFVAKFNPNGARLFWAYFGGTSADVANAIAVDADGNAYIAGFTDSSSIPLQNPYRGTFGGGLRDAFAAKISPTGASLLWSTYLGGNNIDEAYGISLGGNSVAIAGWTMSSDFPLLGSVRPNSSDPDAFVTRLTSNGALFDSTRVGGSGAERAYGVASDGNGAAYITGYTASNDVPSSIAGRTLQGIQDAFVAKLVSSVTGTIAVDKSLLNFGIIGSFRTGAQEVRVTAPANVAWTATATGPLQVTPASGVGPGSFMVSLTPAAFAPSTGSVNVVSGASTSTVAVNINPATGAAPFGLVETPPDNGANISGAIGITGWALDDVEVSRIEIQRKPVPGEGPTRPTGLVYIGDAIFVDGARPDVAGAFPSYPRRTRAGWGLAVLTNMLPNSQGVGVAPRGNGTFEFSVYAYDPEGHGTLIGKRTLTVNNAGATKPFGTLDTPRDGETISGSSYLNWGWALSPPPGQIPLNGSTIGVFVDGQYLGRPAAYGLARSDIDSLFPGYANTGAAVGYYVLDSTRFANGIHTIAWSVTDNLGRTDGIGSRFFWIQNGTSAAPTAVRSVAAMQKPSAVRSARSERIRSRTGYDLEAALANVPTDEQGALRLEVEQGERMEIHVPGAVETVAFDEAGGLPAGSTFDRETGAFYWQLAPVFLNDYTLVFRDADGNAVYRVLVRVKSKGETE